MNIPDEVHWLCDKIEPGSSGAQIHCSIGTLVRRARTIEALVLLACAAPHPDQNWVKLKLTVQLSRCPQCVKNYYTTKKRNSKVMRTIP